MSQGERERSGRPISPEEAIAKKQQQIPSQVFDAFNELIAENLVGNSAIINQERLLKILTEKGLNRGEIFQKHWLDVEALYEKEGWTVEYEKPGYNESGEAYFTFTKKRARRGHPIPGIPN
jgi:hypothetical protein